MFFQIWRGYWIWKLLNSMNYHKILYIVFCVSLTIFIRLEKWNSFSQNEATKYRCRTPHCYSLWREIFFYYSGKIQYLGLKKRVFARKYARWIIFEILVHFGFLDTVWSTSDFEIPFEPLWILKCRLIHLGFWNIVWSNLGGRRYQRTRRLWTNDHWFYSPSILKIIDFQRR